MGQVGTSWSTWDKWDKEKGVFRSTWDKWDKEKGVFRSSWDKWDKDKGSVQLNHSTCPKVGLQGREKYHGEKLLFVTIFTIGGTNISWKKRSLETKKEFGGQNSRTCVRVAGGVTGGG